MIHYYGNDYTHSFYSYPQFSSKNGLNHIIYNSNSIIPVLVHVKCSFNRYWAHLVWNSSHSLALCWYRPCHKRYSYHGGDRLCTTITYSSRKTPVEKAMTVLLFESQVGDRFLIEGTLLLSDESEAKVIRIRWRWRRW